MTRRSRSATGSPGCRSPMISTACSSRDLSSKKTMSSSLSK
ncbi:hypothetical protein [Streptomyces sp. NL15-2K]|nr:MULTISPECIES: hypothetical protein [Actinomycetes]WKX06213.1 hypothetical protein Q4V64_01410 [Kutzneria buriramensis]